MRNQKLEVPQRAWYNFPKIKNWSYGSNLLNWWPTGLKTVLSRHLGQQENTCLNMLSPLTSQVVTSIASIFWYLLNSILPLGSHYSMQDFHQCWQDWLEVYALGFLLGLYFLFQKHLEAWLSSMSRLLIVDTPLRILVIWPFAFIPSRVCGWGSSISIGGLASSCTSGLASSDNNIVFRLDNN